MVSGMSYYGSVRIDLSEEGTRATEIGPEPLGLVWVDCPYPLVVIGLERILEGEAQVHVGREPPTGTPSSIILGTNGVEGLPEGVTRVRKANPDAPVLVFGLHLDLPLAQAALRVGSRGFIHAAMPPEQIIRALKVAMEGEIVAPRELLRYLIENGTPVDLNLLSARQREILEFVSEGLSNAQIAKKLFLSESTIKQHLRATYKLLGVRNRTEAARLIRNDD